MQSYALTPVHTLKILDTGSHTFDHTRIPHTLLGVGNAALAAAVVIPMDVR